jgi:hypothetical protein
LAQNDWALTLMPRPGIIENVDNLENLENYFIKCLWKTVKIAADLKSKNPKTQKLHS